MWRIVHLIASTKSGVDAIATKEADVGEGFRFLSCLGYAGESLDLRHLITAKEIFGEPTRMCIPLSAILFIEGAD